MKLIYALLAFGLIATACTKKEEAPAPAPEAAPTEEAPVDATADTVTE